MDTLRVEVLGSVSRKLTRKFIGKVGVILLEDARHVRVGHGHGDHGVALSGLRVGRVVDASDPHTESHRKRGLLRAQGHLVEHDALEIALVLRRATEVHELALRTPPTYGRSAQCAAEGGVRGRAAG